MANQQVMRLNSTVVCDGCATNVNPYVLKQDWNAESKTLNVHVECPTCGYDWKLDLEA